MTPQELAAWKQAEAAMFNAPAVVAATNNGKTVTGAGPSTPGPQLTPQRATGDAHQPRGK